MLDSYLAAVNPWITLDSQRLPITYVKQLPPTELASAVLVRESREVSRFSWRGLANTAEHFPTTRYLPHKVGGRKAYAFLPFPEPVATCRARDGPPLVLTYL